ncbi:MAG: Fur family transcriptional regulator [Egibacteraceae bacterium]
MASEDARVDRLRAAGLRVTAPRLAVLDALEALDGHPDVDDLARDARGRLGALSTQAVYDILAVFVRAGVARRIQPAGSPARFEARVGDNHHHVVCRVCGATADVDCVPRTAPCLDPSSASAQGFVIDEAEVVFWGRCRRCEASEPRHTIEEGSSA